MKSPHLHVSFAEPNEMQFKHKVVLITGASAGIGAEIAIHFSKLGAHVVLVGRNADNLQEVADKIESNVGVVKPLVIVADVTKEAGTIIDKTIQHFGQLDVLVNNAGISGYQTIESTTLENYDNTMNTNIRSVYHLTMLAVPHLIKTKGNIVNVSSLASLRCFANTLPYAKAALDQFTKCVSLELAPKGVRVNSVNPGVTITNFHTTAGMNAEMYKAYLESASKTHPLGVALGRPGKADDVAAAIIFLASDAASFITGTLLPIDGGKHNVCPR